MLSGGLRWEVMGDSWIRVENSLFYGGVDMKLLYAFQTRAIAEWAADKLANKVQETFIKYSSVRVADVYEFMYDITGSIDFINKTYRDYKYGWTEDPCIHVYRARSWNEATYGLELSDPKLLENIEA